MMLRHTTLVATCLLLLSGNGQAASCFPDNIAANAPDSRYTDNHDNTITDKKTGLIWMKCLTGRSGEQCESGTEEKHNWKSALQAPVLLNADGGFAGHSDWRLPNRKELASLVEGQCSAPAVNSTLFPNQSKVAVWTSTPDATQTDKSWVVHFNHGEILREKRTAVVPIRLVRMP